MNSFKRLVVTISWLALSAGCATAPKNVPAAPEGVTAARQSVTPRTMSFAPLKFEIPKSERVQLKNGAVVYLLQDRELPLVHVTAYFNAGAIYDPPDKVGLASLTGAALRSGGTKVTPPDKLDAELEFMASSIESGINTDIGTVSMATLNKNLDRTLDLFAELLTKPAFENSRVELVKSHAIESLRRENDDPKEVADRELKKAIYRGHPMGRVPTLASLKAISRDDMISFQKRYFYPADMIIAVSGDFDRDKLLAKLEALFGGWPNHPPEFPAVPEPGHDPTPEILLVPKDVNQSVIRMGELGIDKDNPDLYALRVMDYILGGGFTSRLTQEIRSNRGLAYNVMSFFDVGRRFKGGFVAETETKSESTAKVIGMMRSIMTAMTLSEVSDQELALAKNSIINSFAFGFARTDVVVTQQARLEYYHYPAGYLEHYRDNIAKVTKEDVLRVAKKYLHPDAMKLVVVGNAQKFDQPLSVFGSVRTIKLENGK